MQRVSRPPRPQSSITVGVVNGPNLNLLGKREPEHYGSATLAGIDELLRHRAAELGAECESFQSNDEGKLVDWIQKMAPKVDGWVVNAAAFTHTSVALRDALAGAGLPFVEVHISNVFSREPFRHKSLLSDLALGVVVGFRASSYLFGLEGLLERLRSRSE